MTGFLGQFWACEGFGHISKLSSRTILLCAPDSISFWRFIGLLENVHTFLVSKVLISGPGLIQPWQPCKFCSSFSSSKTDRWFYGYLSSGAHLDHGFLGPFWSGDIGWGPFLEWQILEGGRRRLDGQCDCLKVNRAFTFKTGRWNISNSQL